MANQSDKNGRDKDKLNGPSRQQFEQWLDGEEISAQAQQAWAEDQQLKQEHETSLWLKHQAECYQEQRVPPWDAEKTFDFEQQKESWWSRWLQPSTGLPMAMSMAAIFMVLFRVELQFNEQGLLLSFGSDQQQVMATKLEQALEQRLIQHSREQQLIIANHFNDLQTKQQQDVTQLASYLINASRQERKEDIGALVNYFKQQRSEDLTLNQQQLNQVLYQLSSQNNYGDNRGTVRKASYELNRKVEPISEVSKQEEK